MFYFVPKNPAEVEWYEMWEICRFCDDGVDKLEMANVWFADKGFNRPLLFSSSFKNNFYGNGLRMGCRFAKPDIYPIGEDENGDRIMEGVLYDKYSVLAKMMGSKFTYFPNRGGLWDFYAYIADMDEGLTDIVGCGWYGNWMGFQRADFSVAGAKSLSGRNVISVEPLKGIKWYALFQTWDIWVWTLLALTIPVCGINLWVLRKYDAYKNPEGPVKNPKLSNSVWDTAVILFWDAIRVPSPSWPIILNISIYLFISLIMVTAYMGIFTSLIITQRYLTPPIDSIQQFWFNTDLKWVSMYGGQYRYFSGYFNYIPFAEERVHNFSTTGHPGMETLRLIMNNPDKYIMFDPFESVRAFINAANLEAGGRKFYGSKEKFNLMADYFNFPFNTYWKEALNVNWLIMDAMMITEGIEIKSSREADIKALIEKGKLPKEMALIKLKHLVGCFGLLGVGSCLAFIVFIIEILKGIARNFLNARMM